MERPIGFIRERFWPGCRPADLLDLNVKAIAWRDTFANNRVQGPMGFGGKTTLLGVKICAANRLPASFFVSVSYMCWAYRRQGVKLNSNSEIDGWLY